MLDWSKLKTYKTTKQKSFEQLCYQIAYKLYENLGVFTPIDDSGGGDGVEFYLTLKNNEQWGWQAKYYENNPRLSESGRKASIISSLKRTLEIHPNLTNWFLCVPMDLTPSEQKWASEELIKSIPKNRVVEIKLWPQTFIHEKLYQPKFNGLLQAFFGELELNHPWFKNAFGNSFDFVKSKFDEILYTPNEEFEYYYLHPLLCDKNFYERVNWYPKAINDLFSESRKLFLNLDFTTDYNRPLFEAYKEKMFSYNNILETCKNLLHQRLEYINPNNINNLHENDFQAEIDELQNILVSAKQIVALWHRNNENKESNVNKEANRIQFRKISEHESKCDEIITEFRYYVRDSTIPVKWQVGHFLGNGGTGKTNLSIALARENLQHENPVIFVPAVKLTGENSIFEQILRILDIPLTYSFNDFLDALSTLGKISNIRVPIILDGLNEAIINTGSLNSRLRLDLPLIEREISRRTNVVLITTCRSSYQEAIWPNTKRREDNRFHHLSGFTGRDNIKLLVKTYFDHYKIQADLSLISLQQFSTPLYLKIYCETVNPFKEHLIQVTLGHDSIYVIFEKFVQACNKHVFGRLKKMPPLLKYKSLVKDVLRKLAEFLWKNPTRAFNLEALIKMADPDGFPNNDYSQSATKALLDEDLLFVRDYNDEENELFVHLTYDLMAGYFIGDYLVDTIDDFRVFLRGPEIINLASDEYVTTYPYHEDILKSICALLPIKKQLFVHELMGKQPVEENDILWQKLFDQSIDTVFLLSPQYIPKEQVEFILSLLKNTDNILPILNKCKDVFFVIDHPFNFHFFDKLLQTLTMNIRDVTWTEYVREKNIQSTEEIIDEFINLQLGQNHLKEKRQKIEIIATYLFWNFTSTDKGLKKKVAQALYSFGCKNPDEFIKLYLNCVEINDPSVLEWMSVIGYNVSIYITRHFLEKHKDLLVELGHFIYNNFFELKSKNSTNHLSTRDYLFRTLEVIENKIQFTFNLKIIKKDFCKLGITDWKIETDLNEREYRDGNSLIHYRFEKDKMYPIGAGGNEYHPNETYRERLGNLRWRAYNLGYDFSMFGEKDKDIAKFQHVWKLERYADKYINIAYQELCGFLDDRNQFKNYKDDGYMRIEEPIFEPVNNIYDKEERVFKKRFVEIDYINTDQSLTEWCNDRSIPEYKSYLQRKEIMNKKGDWILLHGHLSQHKQNFERRVFLYMDAILVSKKTLKSKWKDFNVETELGRGVNTPFTTNVHDNEIPDGQIIPLNKFTTWHYSTKKTLVKRKYNKYELYRNEIMLSKVESKEIWKIVQARTGLFVLVTEIPVDIPFSNFLNLNDPTNDKIENISSVLEELGVVLKNFIVEKEEEQVNEKTLKVLYPVRNVNNSVYASKNIIDYLELSRIDQTKDLYDSNGELASFNHQFRVAHDDQEEFTYIRKDLIEKYLIENDLEMIFIFWGERDYFPIDGDWLNAGVKAQQRNWASLYEASRYEFN